LIKKQSKNNNVSKTEQPKVYKITLIIKLLISSATTITAKF